MADELLKLHWGDYPHEAAEVALVDVSFRSVFDEFDRRRGEDQFYHIRGVKLGADQDAVTTALQSLEAAYNEDYRNLSLKKETAGTETVHVLNSGDCFGGTKILAFRYLGGNPGVWGMKTEYANKRTFEAVIRGRRLGERGGLLAYHESVTRQFESDVPGGPRRRWIGSLVGTLERQTLQIFTPVITIQSGYAVGDSTWASVNPPKWAAFMQDGQTNEDSPEELVVDGARAFRVWWRYVFVSPMNLSGFPGYPIIGQQA